MPASLMAFAWIATETAELTQMIRQEVESNRNCNDRQMIRFLISQGREKLKGLDEMLDMQGHC
ncbi:Chaperonin like [Actinidia chinensis var. chinensis]|uniref:Chaperonin like n=1 Tax=Actinidia chinensis var. chinensis TaxID=1590841 RepID=A0A2R6R3M1_ACTCC|nr:Chaperonin like [Actinidia chinensis var. chinensis]